MIKEALIAAARKVESATVEMVKTGYTKEKAENAKALVSAALKGLPQYASLKQARTHMREIETGYRDLIHAEDNGVFTRAKVKAELKTMLSMTREDLLPALETVPDNPQAGSMSGNMEERTVLSEDSDIDPKLLESYYNRAQKLPKKISGRTGVAVMANVPILLVGLFGPKLDKLRLLLRTKSFIEGYVLADNQKVLAIDDSSELGLGEALEIYNARAAETLVPVTTESDEISRRLGTVQYYWVMEESRLNKILRAAGGSFFDDWGFPTRISSIQRKSTIKKITDELLETVFKMLKADKPIEDIAKKVGLRSKQVNDLVLGIEMADRTHTLRQRYADTIKRRHTKLLQLKRKLDLERDGPLPKSPHLVRLG